MVVGGRESAVLMIQVTTWRLGRTGLESLMAFHDLTNAFGSVKWEAMDRAVASLLGPNPLIGKQRYRLAITTIPGRDGDITLKIGEGGLMRDPLMVALFWVAFLPSTIRWQQQVAAEGVESEQLLAWHPWSEPSRLWQIVAEQGEDVWHWRGGSNAPMMCLMARWRSIEFPQNRGKEELLMHLVGE